MNKELKASRENVLATRWLECTQTAYQALRPGKSGIEPDIMADLGSSTLGIEVTVAYYGETDARVSWQAARHAAAKKPPAWFSTPILQEFDAELESQVKRLVAQKQTKKYSGFDRLVLLIHLEAMLTDDTFIDSMLPKIRATIGSTQFEEIWLMKHVAYTKYKSWRLK